MTELEQRIREAVANERARCAAIAWSAKINEYGLEQQFVVMVRDQIAQLIEGKTPKQDAA